MDVESGQDAALISMNDHVMSSEQLRLAYYESSRAKALERSPSEVSVANSKRQITGSSYAEPTTTSAFGYDLASCVTGIVSSTSTTPDDTRVINVIDLNPLVDVANTTTEDDISSLADIFAAKPVAGEPKTTDYLEVEDAISRTRVTEASNRNQISVIGNDVGADEKLYAAVEPKRFSINLNIFKPADKVVPTSETGRVNSRSTGRGNATETGMTVTVTVGDELAGGMSIDLKISTHAGNCVVGFKPTEVTRHVAKGQAVSANESEIIKQFDEYVTLTPDADVCTENNEHSMQYTNNDDE